MIINHILGLLTWTFLLLALVGGSVHAQGPVIRREPKRIIIGDTGRVDLESGAIQEFKSGSQLKVGGANVLPSLNGLGATADELNNVADLSTNGGLIRVKKIAISAAPTGAEQDSGWDLPAQSIVLDVQLDITTPEYTGTTKNVSVGTLSSESGGDTDGFLYNVSVNTTTTKAPLATVTVGTTETYYSSTTAGGLLADFKAGTDAAKDFGLHQRKPYRVGAARSVVYQSGSAFTEFRGAIYITYLEVN